MTLFLDPTITDVCRAFLRGFTRRVESGERSDRTAVAYEQALRLGAMRGLAGRPLSTVRTKDVAQMHATMTDERGPASANRAVQTLSMALDEAVRQGLAPDGYNPARLVRLNAKNNNRRTPLARPEAYAVTELCCQAFLEPAGSKVLSPIMGAFFLVVLGLGLRKSEGTHLHMPEWNPERREVTITKHKTSATTGPKTFPASEFITAVLNEVVRRGWHNVWFFPSPRARRGHIEAPDGAWDRVRKACGISSKVRIHDLRHTFAAAVYAATRDLKSVQALLGHSTIGQSSFYVGMLPPDEHREDSQKAMDFMRQPEAASA